MFTYYPVYLMNVFESEEYSRTVDLIVGIFAADWRHQRGPVHQPV